MMRQFDNRYVWFIQGHGQSVSLQKHINKTTLYNICIYSVSITEEADEILLYKMHAVLCNMLVPNVLFFYRLSITACKYMRPYSSPVLYNIRR